VSVGGEQRIEMKKIKRKKRQNGQSRDKRIKLVSLSAAAESRGRRDNTTTTVGRFFDLGKEGWGWGGDPEREIT
jgi:hypothetical protein